MQALLCSLEKASGSRRTRGESKVRIAGRQKPGWGLHRSGPALPSVFTFRKHCSALLWFHYEASVKIIRKKWKLQVKIYTHTHRTGNEEMRTVRKGERVRVRGSFPYISQWTSSKPYKFQNLQKPYSYQETKRKAGLSHITDFQGDHENV